MYKIVINDRHGGFGLSNKAIDWLKTHGIEVDDSGHIIDEECKKDPHYCNFASISDYTGIIGNFEKPIERHNPLLVQCVEELGEEASGKFCSLIVVEIEGNLYRIQDYDGLEYVETPGDIDWTIITL